MKTSGVAPVIKNLASLVKPPPNISVVEWAEKHRNLSPENCALPGPYRVSITPYLKDILEDVTNPDIEKIVCQKSAQVAWTDGFINNVLGYYVDCDPGPIMAMFPTDDMAARYSKEKLTPMIRDCDVLTEKIAKNKSRDGGNTLYSKTFPGGHLELVGSNSPAPLASSPVRIAVVEEPDRCARNAGGEGNSLKVFYERTKTFHNRKILVGGSPTIKGASSIETEMALSDYRKYNIPCPHCEHKQTLEWKMVVWEKSEELDHPVYGQHNPSTAKLKCTNCNKLFNNAQKIQQLSKGEWIATQPFSGVRGYFISELYSPFPKATLTHVVEKFLEADQAKKRGDNTLMIVWMNTALGETWEEKGDKPDWEKLQSRAEDYEPMTVPSKGMLLVAGVDTQDNRLAVTVTAYGRGKESWRIYHAELFGDPASSDVWERLDTVLNRKYKHESGIYLKIVSAAIDSGGHRTQAVYNYVRHKPEHIIAIRGASTANKPVISKPTKQDVTWDGRLDENGVELWLVGSDTIKYQLYGMLDVEKEGPGYWHFYRELTLDYYQQLTAESKVTKFKKGQAYTEWVTTGRNEALDCEVYAYAAAVRVGLDTMDWDRIQAQFNARATNIAHPNKQQDVQHKNNRPMKSRRVGTISEVKL